MISTYEMLDVILSTVLMVIALIGLMITLIKNIKK